MNNGGRLEISIAAAAVLSGVGGVFTFQEPKKNKEINRAQKAFPLLLSLELNAAICRSEPEDGYVLLNSSLVLFQGGGGAGGGRSDGLEARMSG